MKKEAFVRDRAIAKAISRSALHRGGPGSIPVQVMWDLLLTKLHWDRYPVNICVSPANSQSSNRSSSEVSAVGQLVADAPSGLNLTHR
jgi:hypothetical protein